MSLLTLKQQVATSPAFILDEDQVIANLQIVLDLQKNCDCKVLYAIKALPLSSLLALLKNTVDGLSVSSLFEARLAHEILAGQGSIHLTTPGLRHHEFTELAQICSHISFNSISQYQNLQQFAVQPSLGLRINPKLSFANDQRYDPCRLHSKLGIDWARLKAGLPSDIEGLHLHTVFACEDLEPLRQTIAGISPLLKANPQLKWLNLGGGYLYQNIGDLSPLRELIRLLRKAYQLDVYLEPGKALVGNAGYLLSTVLDKFSSDGKTVLILDTSVNHHPEVFEYQLKPKLMEESHNTTGQVAILAGSSCLAGDLFGEYHFETIPNIGDRLVFNDVGAYSLIKANRFNGYNLPDVYRISDGQLYLSKHYDYADYRRQW